MKYIVRYKRLAKDAVPPKKAHPSDAGWDLTVNSSNSSLKYGSGLAFDLSEVGYALAFPRSSVYKTGMVLSNSVGVIDGGYRGEVTAKFFALENYFSGKYKKGDRFLQLVFPALKIGDEVEFVEVDELEDSDRGTGGYGSTGR